MFFYLLIIPALLLLITAISRIHNLKKHDLVLFELCQIRRDAISELRNHHLDMKAEDYYAIRKLLDPINSTIHYYKECKIEVFNLRTFCRHIEKLKMTKTMIDNDKLPDNQKIAELHKRFNLAILKAFFTYTPFIWTTIFLSLSILLFQFLIKICGDHCNTWINRFLDSFSWLKLNQESLKLRHQQ